MVGMHEWFDMKGGGWLQQKGFDWTESDVRVGILCFLYCIFQGKLHLTDLGTEF